MKHVMKQSLPLILIMVMFSCGSPSSKITGKWMAIGVEGGTVNKMDGIGMTNAVMSLEFKEDGNVFYNLAGNLTPYKWELSNDKIVLTSQLSSETIEVIENRLLITAYNGMPVMFIKEEDDISLAELESLLKRNWSKSQYLQQLQNISN